MESVLSPPELPSRYRIISTATHFDIVEKYTTDRKYLLPTWMENVTDKKLRPHLYRDPEFSQFQLFVIEGADDTSTLSPSSAAWNDVKVVGHLRSIPFYWAALDSPTVELEDALMSLPDGGWEEIFKLGYNQAKNPSQNSTPNLLCGLSIHVFPEYRHDNIANILIQRMKALAAHHDLKAVAIPVRPTRKSEFPTVPMDEYIKWRTGVQGLAPDKANDNLPLNRYDGTTTYDPWVRKHCKLGGRVLKPCLNAFRVDLDLDDFAARSGVDIWAQIQARSRSDGTDADMGDFYNVQIPDALVLVKCYPTSRRAVYLEPNVWVYHRV